MESSIGNNLPRVKVQNQFSIKEIVYKFGPISRIEIADRLGLTLPTITTSVSSMIKNGLLKEVEQDHSVKSLGRRTMLVDINEDSRRIMGIEIRGTVRNGVIVDARGNVIVSMRDDHPYSDYESSIKSAASLSISLLESSGLTWDDIDGVGITIPGIVDKDEGKLIIHPGYKWKDKNIKDDFVSLSGFKGIVSVENNTIARAFALVMFDGKVLEDADSMAYMFVSAGIGCPLLNNVKAHFGHVTGDGEVGHMIMQIDGEPCSCGNRGCLEAYSSEKTILDKSLGAIEKGKAPYLASIYEKKKSLVIYDVIEAGEKGDEGIKEILFKATRYLGLAIANIENFVKPERMVIEGKIFDKEEYRKILLDTVYKNLYRGTFQDLKLHFKKSDDFSGAIGASAIAIKRDLELFLE
ncbi:MAG: ROK family transcriptional regulator [Spirochaetales bacterium]|nr:ROK family transcriptional regulator [Spirochaetales bacterium]